MEKELKDFIDDWQIDIKSKSAQHKSGLKIGYDSTNEDGTIRLAYSGMSTFLRNTFTELKSVEAVEKRRTELTQEFTQIFKAKMTTEFSKAPVKPNIREY
jgi:tRNA A37 threonylcarbamoyltransferase TsaD